MLVGSTMECWNQLACHTALVARRQKWHQTSIETDGTPSHSIKENLKRGKRLKKKQIALGAKRNCTASKNLKSRIWRETLQSARGQNRQRRKLCWVKKVWVDITSYQFVWQKSDQLTHFFHLWSIFPYNGHLVDCQFWPDWSPNAIWVLCSWTECWQSYGRL